MTVRYADLLKNAMLDAYETHYGASPVLKIYTGAVAASVGTAPAGTLLASLTLPADWMAAAAAGAKSKSGTWEDLLADNTGTAGCFTIETSGGTIKEDGTVTATGGGGDMTFNTVSFVSGSPVTITGFTKSI